jgi:hypothetical protein
MVGNKTGLESTAAESKFSSHESRSVIQRPEIRRPILQLWKLLGCLAPWLLGCICCVFFLAVSGRIRAADDRAFLATQPLDIRVQAGGFGRVSSADITAVLQSAASEICRHCRRIRLDGIDVYHRTDHPQIDFQRTSSGRIAIGLATQDTYWAQYSFQFAHEFCHALANFGDNPHQLVRYPSSANLWLEESLCETASLFTLRAMSRSWHTAPPYPAWQDYAPWFNLYVEQRLALPEHHLPAGMPFVVWFHQNQSALRQNSETRDRNTLIAIQLLPIFEREPRGWEALVYLNRGSRNANESLPQHLAEWRSQCPGGLRPFVTRLAAVFAVKL